MTGSIAGARRKLERPGAAAGHGARDHRRATATASSSAGRPTGPEEHGAAAEDPDRREQRATPGPAAGIGDRVLARITPLGSRTTTIAYQARAIKARREPTRDMLGIVRALPGGAGVIEPIDRKQLKEWPVPRGGTERRQERRPGPLRARRPARFGLRPRASPTGLGNPQDEQATSLIAIHAHGIPTASRTPCSRKPKRPRRRR